MKVLYLVSGIGPPAGWGTEFIQNLIFLLSEKGIQATIINPIYIHTNPNWKSWSQEIKNQYNVRIINLEAPNWIKKRLLLHFLLTPLFVTVEVFKILRNEQFNLVHEFSSTPIILFRAGLIKFFFRIPTVFTLSVYNNSLFGKYFWFKVFNFAKFYLIPSRELIGVIKKIGVSNNQLIYSPPGVDLKLFKRQNQKLARKKLELPGDKFIVSYFGSLTFEKGVDEIIEAAKKLSNPVGNHLLIIIFTIWKGSTDHQILTKKIKAAKLNNLTFRQEYIDVPTLLSASNVVLFPQRSGFGTTIPPIGLIEALAARCFIIASNTVGIREAIKGSGIIIPPHDPVSLANAIQKAYLKKLPPDRSTKNIRLYELERSISLHLDVYRKVL